MEETIQSILTQTFEDLELIISDNASTDKTEEICQTYAARDKRIQYCRSVENLGAAWNYNRVFELSSGEYFKWAAADDFCAPNFIEKCVDALDRLPQVILSYPKTTIIDERGDFVRNYDRSLHLQSTFVEERFRQAIHTIAECNAIFGLTRSSVLRRTSLIGNYMASDRVLLVELSLYGQFYEIPERLFFRRWHSKASSSNKSVESQQEFFDPKTKGRIFLLNWKHVIQHLLAIKNSPLTLTEKGHLLTSVCRFMADRRYLLVRELFTALKQVANNEFKIQRVKTS